MVYILVSFTSYFFLPHSPTIPEEGGRQIPVSSLLLSALIPIEKMSHPRLCHIPNGYSVGLKSEVYLRFDCCTSRKSKALRNCSNHDEHGPELEEPCGFSWLACQEVCGHQEPSGAQDLHRNMEHYLHFLCMKFTLESTCLSICKIIRT